MKYFIYSIILFFLLVPKTLAVSVTPIPETTSAPTEESKTEALTKQINNLKDKIASTVASLKLVEKRGIIGTVSEVKDTQVTITDNQQKTRIIDIDEITKFSSPSAKSTFGISDLVKGSTISVLGLYNKQSRRITGRFIEVTTKPVFISGVVSNIDEDEFTLSVLDVNKTTTIVDIEKITKTNSYTKEGGIIKSGFSKLSLGDRVLVTGYPQLGKTNRITGLRILKLPEVARNPMIEFDYPQVSPTLPSKKTTPTP